MPTSFGRAYTSFMAGGNEVAEDKNPNQKNQHPTHNKVVLLLALMNLCFYIF